ncbi:cupin domain-containing protein [Aurantibacillus circumpalustris]|uniref:cupin domain-containing protein n=1 Tax=Aurantibacillus circumpalustris TaxID=3036359 RepID=UPI00295B08BE|nr:cupin domain-containing protein [Aurantibacillus circumpalustris]
MTILENYIKTGILEQFVLGLSTELENLQVKEMCIQYPQLEVEIDTIIASLITYGETNAPEIDPTIKPLLIATIDYTERLKNGETPTFPPELNERSLINDYAEWLNRKDLELLNIDEEIELKLIGHTPKIMTAILRINTVTPAETHTKEFEKFLILEGSCDIETPNKTYSLTPGDYFSIPLHVKHSIKVTSKEPCKVILQRVAA